MTPIHVLYAIIAIILSSFWLTKMVPTDGLSNQTIYDSFQGELDIVDAAPWPEQLPGLIEIESYLSAKEKLLHDPRSDRGVLRHALMDRCQAHVAWLIRFEREQGSIERMAKRGMMSETDFQKFTRFAESLEVEVNDVREEAGWLCEDPAGACQASDEIWRIAVQIWHQRRQVCTETVRPGKSACGLKGLKGGFLSKHAKGGTNAQNINRTLEDSSGSSSATSWPEQLPSEAAVQHYESLKGSLLSEGSRLTKEECQKQLRDLLMERCRLQIPWMQRVQQERQRLRAAAERAQWLPCATSPTADDIGKLKDFEAKCIAESLKVKEEAEWLGDEDGAPGFCNRIWPIAIELHTQAAKVSAERAQEKALKAYAKRTAKAWPSELPGIAQRSSYEQLKASALRGLSPLAQAAMLQGKSAPHVIGVPASRQLRGVLMSRCQQMIPVIQRLESEGRAFKTAAKQGLADDQDAARFLMKEANFNAEINAVKAEAEWLSDDAGTGVGIGNHVWPAAFEIYSKRRAQITKQIKLSHLSHHQDNSCLLRADAVD